MKSQNNYLSLQIENRLYNLFGTPFQSLMEQVLALLYPSFKKVWSGGGDGGNDGFIEESNTFYQFYSPAEPIVNDTTAASKMKSDFIKLKDNWSEYYIIEKFIFIYNDKGYGAKKVYIAKAELELEYAPIKFEVMGITQVKNLMDNLNNTQLIALGFDIESLNLIKIANKFLENIAIEIDRENAEVALRMLKEFDSCLNIINSPEMILKKELYTCKTLRLLERNDEAFEKYNELAIEYPKDPQACLCIAEMHLIRGDEKNNLEYLKLAEERNDKFWLLKVEKAIREYNFGRFDIDNHIMEADFPDLPRDKSVCYRIFSQGFAGNKDFKSAYSYLKKAIRNNENRLSNYIEEISIMLVELDTSLDVKKLLDLIKKLKEKISWIYDNFNINKNRGNRSCISLLIAESFLRYKENDLKEAEYLLKKALENLLLCSWNDSIQLQLIRILLNVILKENELDSLTEYLICSNAEMNIQALILLLVQFNLLSKLETEGSSFCQKANLPEGIKFIDSLISNKHDDIITILGDRYDFHFQVINGFRNYELVCNELIKMLPEKYSMEKNYFKLGFLIEAGAYNEAYEILLKVDLFSEPYRMQTDGIIKVYQEVKADGDMVKYIKGLQIDSITTKHDYVINIQLFNAYLKLKSWKEMIELGEYLLITNKDIQFYTGIEIEALLGQIVYACIECNGIVPSILEKAEDLIANFSSTTPSLEFRITVLIRLQLMLNNSEKVTELIRGLPCPENKLTNDDLVRIYVTLILQNDCKLEISSDTLDRVSDDTYIKFKNKDKWYYIGDSYELDSIKISNTNLIYNKLIDKKIGDKIDFSLVYSPARTEYEIEIVFSAEQYILMLAQKCFDEMSRMNAIEGVTLISVIDEENEFDLSNMLSYLSGEDEQRRPFFNLYTEKNLPFSMLALNESGLFFALGKIQNEAKGFIHCTSGTTEEYLVQKQNTNKVISGEETLVLGGLSAWFLTEKGLFEKALSHIPNIAIPQSVFNFLVEAIEAVKFKNNHNGRIGFANGKIQVNRITQKTADAIELNIKDAIAYIEKNGIERVYIAQGDKKDCMSESRMINALCDACIWAQKNDAIILTDDYLYLDANHLETGKAKPQFTTSIALMRVLYERELISFADYIEYFYYLSSYRVRFLSLDSNDMEKAIFGDGKIIVTNVKGIENLNLPLTLSKEYGVSIESLLKVVGIFLYKIIIDPAIVDEIKDKIFIELLGNLPSDYNKQSIGKLLLKTIENAFENENPIRKAFLRPKIFKATISRLRKLSDYNHFKLL